MKAEELRIGNWVEWEDGDKDIIEIDAVSDCGGVSGMSEEELYITEIKYINPIPLTEEWLLKFGFEVHPNSFSCSIFHLTEWDDYPLNWCVAMNKNNAIIVSKLKHAHQLQNLYFALTGEELKQLEK